MVNTLSEKVSSYDGIYGIHDLVIHNYGPSKWMACLHAEIPADGDLLASHDLIDRIEKEIYHEMGIELVIHLDPIVTNDERINDMRIKIASIVHDINPNLSIHDFRMVEGPSHTNLIFDVVTPYNLKISDSKLLDMISQSVSAELGNCYFVVVTFDREYA